MVGVDSGSDHFVILKGWKQSAEHNRGKLSRQVEINPHGCYRVRMEGSQKWIDCESPPVTGAAEWLFVNQRAVPLFYWNVEKNSIVLI